MSTVRRAGDLITLAELYRAGLYVTERDGEQILADAATGLRIEPDGLVLLDDPEPEPEAEP